MLKPLTFCLNPIENQPTVITIGNFDGFHLGHQHVFKALMTTAQNHKPQALAISFDPHPRTYFTKKTNPYILDFPKRIEKIKAMFPNVTYGLFEFNQTVANTSASDFLQFLQNQYQMQALVMGQTTHIGKDRQGTPEIIKQLSQQQDFDLEVLKPVTLENQIISSTEIRKQIQAGNIQKANAFLGSAYLVSGTVIKGQSLGTKLGYPTANIAFDPSQILPKNGVYAGWVKINGQKQPCAINLGLRPTIDAQNQIHHLEVHIIDTKANLYDQTLEIHWIDFIRSEKQFSTQEQLKKQIQKDIQTTKQIFSNIKS